MHIIYIFKKQRRQTNREECDGGDCNFSAAVRADGLGTQRKANCLKEKKLINTSCISTQILSNAFEKTVRTLRLYNSEGKKKKSIREER
jgi:hypothetical protein